jgi:hypothetical protein
VKLRAAVVHGKKEMTGARARVTRTGKLSGFATIISRAVGTLYNTRRVWAVAVAKYLFWPNSHCSSFCQGQQRRDDVAAVEEQLGRCSAGQRKYCRLYLYSGKLTLAAMYLKRVRVVGCGFAVGAPPLTHVLTVLTPPAPATQNLTVGLRRPLRGQTCGVMLGAMARNAPVRSAMPCSTTALSLCRFFFRIPHLGNLGGRWGERGGN